MIQSVAVLFWQSSTLHLYREVFVPMMKKYSLTWLGDDTVIEAAERAMADTIVVTGDFICFVTCGSDSEQCGNFSAVYISMTWNAIISLREKYCRLGCVWLMTSDACYCYCRNDCICFVRLVTLISLWHIRLTGILWLASKWNMQWPIHKLKSVMAEVIPIIGWLSVQWRVYSIISINMKMTVYSQLHLHASTICVYRSILL
jgi:hypothetical protein